MEKTGGAISEKINWKEFGLVAIVVQREEGFR